MYKALVIDDEKYIRKSIMNRIDWKNYGVTEMQEAGNGQEALEILKIFKPQIVLVDIRMPKMDGLEFIAKAKKIYPNIDYIIMSAYSDFAYAQKAISLGVNAYLLKPIDEEELGKLLNTIFHRRKEEQFSRISRKIQIGELESKDVLKNEFVTAVAFYLDNEDETDRGLIQFVREEASKYEKNILYYLHEYSRSSCCVFFLNTTKESAEDARSCVEAVLDMIGTEQIWASVSHVFPRKKMKEALKQSICYLKRKMFYQNRHIISHSSQEERDSSEQRKKVRQKLERIYHQISIEEFSCVKDELLELIDSLLNEMNPVYLMEEGIEEILLVLRHLPEEASGNMNFNILFHEFRSEDYLLVYHTVDELRESLKNLVIQFVDIVQDRAGEDIIIKIKEYIEHNFGEDLGVSLLAEKYGLNISYLSTLFKKRVGVNLVSYIEGVRMEKAKEFLGKREWPVTEVAMHTGYSNSNYFSKVFKKYTGITPREYRNQQKK